MRLRKKIHAALLVAVGSATIVGCASIFGLDELTQGAAQDSGTETSTDAAVADGSMFTPDAGNPCLASGYPDRPAADTLDGGDFSILVALSKIDFGLLSSPDAGGTTTSYNLDKICTVSTTSESCKSAAPGTAFGNYVVDKTEAGADNAGISLIQYIAKQGPAFTPEHINERLQLGQFGAVIAVDGYNGLSDDTQVNVNFFPSFGLETDGGVTFDSTDVWRIDNGNLVTTDTSMWLDTTAYVTGGKLVAHVPHAPLGLTVDENNPLLVLRFDDAVLTADIVAVTPGVFRLTNGVVAGRIKTQPFIDSINRLYYNPLPGPSDFICNEPTFRTFITDTICDARDIMSNSLSDNTGMTCDAFSAGAGFDSYAVAKWKAGTSPPAPYEAGCAVAPDCK